jgi:hypothetical protein
MTCFEMPTAGIKVEGSATALDRVVHSRSALRFDPNPCKRSPMSIDADRLFFEAVHSIDPHISESLFRDELRRVRKKHPNRKPLDDCTDALQSLTSVAVPLVNEPTEFPDFGGSYEDAYVKPRSIDLHGFNRHGATVATRRMILNRDPTRGYTLKINVGQALHTIDGKEGVVRPCAERVCREYGYEPEVNSVNEGWIVITMPPTAHNTEQGTE